MKTLSISTKFAYGVGQVAEGIKSRGFDIIVFFYFTQVLGLQGSLAGAAVAVALIFDAITDPNTGEPVLIDLNNMGVLIPSALARTTDRIIRALEVREGDITAGTGRQTIAMPWDKVTGLKALTNQYVKTRTSSASTWFIGNFMQAFAYYENWPIQTPPIPPNNHWEIMKDVAHSFKVTERGEYQALQPRKVVKSTA